MRYKEISTVCLVMVLASLASTRTVDGQENVPNGWVRAGSRPQDYEMSLDPSARHGGTSSARIRFIGQTADGFGTLMQTFKAEQYRGKRLRLTAWMKTESADSAQLWMRLDAADRRMVGFDNMGNRPVKGTTGWNNYAITLDVPAETLNIAFGGFVAGKGQAWIDDFAFEIVGNDVPTTNQRTPEVPAQPLNLSFEDQQK